MGKLNISKDGVKKTEKRNLDFVEGTGIDITIVDGAQEDAAEITIAATGGGSAHVIADAGVAETQRATLDFQDGFIVTDNAGADSTDVDLDYGTGATQPAAGNHTHAGGSAHTIQDDDVSVTDRTKLSFQDGFVVTDDAGGDQTELDLSYAVTPSTQAFGDAAAAGTAITVTRGDHKHAMPADPVTAHEAAADPHTGYLKETDFDDVDFLVGTATGHTAAEIVVGTSPGGELGGTWASPTVDATHSGSTHSASTDTHIADTADAHDASAISADSTTLVGTGTDVQAVLEELDNSIVDHAAAADPHTGYRLESADHSHASTGLQAGQVSHADLTNLTTGDPHTQYVQEALVDAKGDIIVGTAADTVARLAAGTVGNILQSDTVDGVQWTTPWHKAFVPTNALAENFPRILGLGANAAALTTQRMYMGAIYLPDNLLITSISFVSGGTALVTGVNQWFALYDSSLNLLRQTNDDTSTAWGANTVKTLNLSTTFTTTAAGMYYIGIMVNATTVPTLRSFAGATATTLYGIAPILFGQTSDTGLTTTAPNPAGAITVAGSNPYYYVS
jgi:hypothetical protein